MDLAAALQLFAPAVTVLTAVGYLITRFNRVEGACKKAIKGVRKLRKRVARLEREKMQ